MPNSYLNSGYKGLVKHVKASNVRRRRAKVGVTCHALMQEDCIKPADVSKLYFHGKLLRPEKRREMRGTSFKPRTQRGSRKKCSLSGKRQGSGEISSSFFLRSTSPKYQMETAKVDSYNSSNARAAGKTVGGVEIFLEKVTVKELPLYWLTEAGPHKPRSRPRSAGIRNARLKHRKHIELRDKYAKGSLLQHLETFKKLSEEGKSRRSLQSPQKRAKLKKKMVATTPKDTSRRRQLYERNSQVNGNGGGELLSSGTKNDENMHKVRGASHTLGLINASSKRARPQSARTCRTALKGNRTGAAFHNASGAGGHSNRRRPRPQSARPSTRRTAKWGIQSELGKIAVLKMKNHFRSQQGDLGNQLERCLERRRLERQQNLNVRARTDSILNPDVKMEISTSHNIQRRASAIDKFRLKNKLVNHQIFREVCQSIADSKKGYPMEGPTPDIEPIGDISARDLKNVSRELTEGERILLELMKRLMIQDILITKDVLFSMLVQLDLKKHISNVHIVPTIQVLFRSVRNMNKNISTSNDISMTTFMKYLAALENVNVDHAGMQHISEVYSCSYKENVRKSQAKSWDCHRTKLLKAKGYSTTKPETRQRRGGKLSTNNKLSDFS